MRGLPVKTGTDLFAISIYESEQKRIKLFL